MPLGRTAKAFGAVGLLLDATVASVGVTALPAGASPKTAGVPSRPTHVTAIGADTAVDVSWNPPKSIGAGPITGYAVTVTGPGSPTSCATNATTLTCDVAGLQNGSRYDVTVSAENGLGSGKASKGVRTTPTAAVRCAAAKHPHPYDNLQGCHLSRHKFTGADLANSDLSGTDLSDATLVGTNLSSANLSSADLTGADLIGADLNSADLTDTDLSGADLSGVDLTGATLTGANLQNVSSGDITGTPTALPANWIMVDGYLIGPGADLAGAELALSDMSLVDLSGANLSAADLSNAAIQHSNLADADLAAADLDNVDMNDDTMTDADLSGAHIGTGGITNSNLKGADLSDINLNGSDISYDNLTNATMLGDFSVRQASLIDDTWSNTTCSDGTNSDVDGGTCTED
jgi:uncharacterized protein YjbI with pentapeptide repeats